MRPSAPNPLAVCSWSLRPTSPADLVEQLKAAGLDAVQLHLDPLRAGWDEAATLAALRRAGVTIVSGMMTMAGEDYDTLESIRATGGVRPDATWPANLAAAADHAAMAARLGLTLVTFHAGWIPHDSADPLRGVMLQRLRTLIDVFAKAGVRVGLETGQESAATLLDVLAELPASVVNFDPANMLLYGMGDAHEALQRLGPRVAQIHAKDALPAGTPGQWGSEVPVGTGGVDWPRFVAIARAVCPRAGFVIEREAGDQRVADVRAAAAVLRPLLEPAP